MEALQGFLIFLIVGSLICIVINEQMNLQEIMTSFPCLALIDFSIQISCWIIASICRTEMFYDLAGSSTFIVLMVINYQWSDVKHLRQIIQTFCVIIWAIRLGLFLFVRILKAGEDRRFRNVKTRPFKFLVYWILQGFFRVIFYYCTAMLDPIGQAVWVFVTLFPSLLAVSCTNQRPVGSRDYIGWGLWLSGFLIEVIADLQKTLFRNDPVNKDKFISTGIWKWSRHPNYFGEILLWFGLYISASSTFSGYQYLSVASPALVYLLITQVSGIPPLESHAMHKWASNPQYQKYLKETPVLLPFIG